MKAKNSTDVRKNWSETIDSAVMSHPEFIKRNRDLLTLINTSHLEKLLTKYNIYVEIEYVENSVYIAKIPVFDIFVKADTISEVSDISVSRMIEFCEKYYENLDINVNLPDRADLLPYVLKVIIAIINEYDVKDMLIIKN